MKVALVIRPDGTVSFDDRHPHRLSIIGHLAASGHELEHLPNGDVRIVSGPMKPAPGND